MKNSDINIRDPFVLAADGKYYMYGTRANNFGCSTAGFDVYVSTDLVNWSEPIECFNSSEYGLNRHVNWAPEVHYYRDAYYMLATFTKDNGLRGTYILKADKPLGPFSVHSNGAVTPSEWECLDGTLYIDKSGKPHIVFCHEHTQIIDGTVCYAQLNDELTATVGEPVTLFAGSSFALAGKKSAGEHYITDGPFMYRTKADVLLMIWSTFISGKYAQCVAASQSGEINGPFCHLSPLITDDGGHGMIFKADNSLMLTFHTPNKTGLERPTFREIIDIGDTVVLK